MDAYAKCLRHLRGKNSQLQTPVIFKDEFPVRYLDLRVEVQWQKEALDSGRLVAKCPSCSFLVLCNTQEDRG